MVARIDALPADWSPTNPKYRVQEWIRRWTAFGLCTEPADRPLVERGIRDCYQFAGLVPPEIRWAASPTAVGRIAVSVGDSVGDSVVDSVVGSVWNSVRNSVGDSVRNPVWNSVVDSVVDSVWNPVGDSVQNSVWDSVWGSVERSVVNSVVNAVGDSVVDSVWNSVRDSVGGSVRYSVWNSVWRDAHDGGQFWCDGLAFCAYFRDVLALDAASWTAKLDALITMRSAGPLLLFRSVVIVCERPSVIRIEANRLHAWDGLALEWRDGTGLRCWRGIEPPADIVADPTALTVARIDGERNAEIRRILLERYDLGSPGRFVADSGAEVVNDDPRWGRLYRREMPSGPALLQVRVENPTPEPDGTRRVYWLGVDAECRPALPDGGFGEPQELTARNAVAASWGLRGEDIENMEVRA